MAPGRIVGDFTLEAPLGRGAVGEVWRARRADGSVVAIKLLLAGQGASDDVIARFEREARVAQRLVHPGIVRVLDVGSSGGERWIAMELVEGETLAARLLRGRLAPGEALRIALEVAQALEAAHAQGVVHRDVKPGNILLDAQGGARVTDFGLAKVAAESGATSHGALLGTPAYMAPEQAFGAPDEVGPRADVHALGAVLYEMLAGRPPHVGATSLALLRKLEDEEPAPPSTHAADVPAHLDAVVLRALAKDPARRTPSARALADELLAAVAGAPSVPPATPRPGRRPALVPVLVLALVAGLAATAALRHEDALARARRGLDEALGAPDRHARLERTLAELRADGAAATPAGLALAAEAERHLGRAGQAARTLAPLGAARPDLVYRRVLDLVAATPQLFNRPSLRRPSLRRALDEAQALLAPPERFVLEALARALEGVPGAAEDRLTAAVAAGADAAEVAEARVRVRLVAWSLGPDAATATALDAALAELSSATVTATRLGLEAAARAARDDEAGAWATADRLLAVAPTSAETFLVRAALHEDADRWAEAQGDLETALRLDPACDAGLRLTLVEARRALDVRPGLLAEVTWQDQLLARLGPAGSDDPPLVHLLRALVDVLRERWDDAATHLRAMEAGGGAHDVDLGGLPTAAGSRALLLAAASYLLGEADQVEEAVEAGEAALDALNDEDRDDEEERALRADWELGLARLLAEDDQDDAVPHLQRALEAGAARADIEADDDLDPLLGREDVKALLARFPGKAPE